MNNNQNLLILAPMEGVLDPLMRSILTQINDYDLCITEFIRVVSSLVPKKVFYKTCPELHHQGVTPSQTPIRVQLLGQHPQWMAENALRAIAMGSQGIDINFGCPAKAVNKSRGGAVLLKDPETIYQIVSTVKEALTSAQELSVKIRLGFDDDSLLNEIVDAIVSANADMLTIHARTKLHGYKPPAYWHLIKSAMHNHKIKVVANGEIWSKEDALLCQQRANTAHLMLGRGALALPNLANVIKSDEAPMPWLGLCELIKDYSVKELEGDKSFYFSSRLKQWLRYLKLQYPEANTLFEKIKLMKNKQDILFEIHKLM